MHIVTSLQVTPPRSANNPLQCTAYGCCNQHETAQKHAMLPSSRNAMQEQQHHSVSYMVRCSQTIARGCLREGLLVVPVVTEEELTVTAPKLLPYTAEVSPFFNALEYVAAPVELPSKKSVWESYTVEPECQLETLYLTGLCVNVSMLAVTVLISCTQHTRYMSDAQAHGKTSTSQRHAKPK